MTCALVPRHKFYLKEPFDMGDGSALLSLQRQICVLQNQLVKQQPIAYGLSTNAPESDEDDTNIASTNSAYNYWQADSFTVPYLAVVNFNTHVFVQWNGVPATSTKTLIWSPTYRREADTEPIPFYDRPEHTMSNATASPLTVRDGLLASATGIIEPDVYKTGAYIEPQFTPAGTPTVEVLILSTYVTIQPYPPMDS